MNKFTYHSDKNTGISKVVLQNKDGHFVGFSFCAEEDFDTYSAYAGERYAEMRASITYAKFKYKQEKIKLKTIQNLMKDIEYDTKCGVEQEPHTLRKVKLKLRDYTQSAEDWKNLYEYLEKSLQKQIAEREKILQRTKKDK